MLATGRPGHPTPDGAARRREMVGIAICPANVFVLYL
jgi:hypothetical protein